MHSFETVCRVARAHDVSFQPVSEGWTGCSTHRIVVFVPAVPPSTYGRGIKCVGADVGASALLARIIFEAIERGEGKGGDARTEVILTGEDTPARQLMADIVREHASRYASEPRLSRQWIVAGSATGEAIVVYPQRVRAAIDVEGRVKWSGRDQLSDGPLAWEVEIFVMAYRAAMRSVLKEAA